MTRGYILGLFCAFPGNETLLYLKFTSVVISDTRLSYVTDQSLRQSSFTTFFGLSLKELSQPMTFIFSSRQTM